MGTFPDFPDSNEIPSLEVLEASGSSSGDQMAAFILVLAIILFVYLCIFKKIGFAAPKTVRIYSCQHDEVTLALKRRLNRSARLVSPPPQEGSKALLHCDTNGLELTRLKAIAKLADPDCEIEI